MQAEETLLPLARGKRVEESRNNSLTHAYFNDQTGGKTPAITLLPERKKTFGESRSFISSYNSFPRQEEPF